MSETHDDETPWWESVSDPDPAVREQAHIEAEQEADAHYPDTEPDQESTESEPAAKDPRPTGEQE